MAMDRVEYGEVDGVKAMSFIGNVRYTSGPFLSRLLKVVCSGPVPQGFVIDLTQTESLDSTSLGLLARIAKWMQQGGGEKPVVVSTNEDINDVLVSIGFDEIFTIVQSEIGKAESVQVIPLENGERAELPDVVLEAHRALMALNEENRRGFREVVELLEAQKDD